MIAPNWEEMGEEEMKQHKPESKMPSILKTDAERARAKGASLTKQYRAIGPAAIAAALVCKPKKVVKPA